MVILFHINNNYTAQNWYETGKQEPIRRTKIYFLDISLSLKVFIICQGFSSYFILPSSSLRPSLLLNEHVSFFDFFIFFYLIFVCELEENKNQNAINTEIDKDI